jgi:hypothetical protein
LNSPHSVLIQSISSSNVVPGKSAWAKALCCLLIAISLSNAVPAHAALIGTSDALERRAVLNALERADVARELQAYGIDPALARERVAALTDDEARALAGRINALPPGADAAGILLLVVVVALIWWLWKR